MEDYKDLTMKVIVFETNDVIVTSDEGPDITEQD